jgi:hypothetical protein
LKKILGQQESIKSRQRLFSRYRLFFLSSGSFFFLRNKQKSRKKPKNSPQFLLDRIITESSISAVVPAFTLERHKIKKNISTQLKKDGKSAVKICTWTPGVYRNERRVA